jgi:hypothetical protein
MKEKRFDGMAMRQRALFTPVRFKDDGFGQKIVTAQRRGDRVPSGLIFSRAPAAGL